MGSACGSFFVVSFASSRSSADATSAPSGVSLTRFSRPVRWASRRPSFESAAMRFEACTKDMPEALASAETFVPAEVAVRRARSRRAGFSLSRISSCVRVLRLHRFKFLMVKDGHARHGYLRETEQRQVHFL